MRYDKAAPNDARLQLAAVADGETELETLFGRHVDACLQCQAQLAQYRKLLRGLRGLKGQTELPDARLLDEIFDAVRPPASVHKLHRRHLKVAYIGSIAAAATAGAAAGAYVLATRLVSKQKLAS